MCQQTPPEMAVYCKTLNDHILGVSPNYDNNIDMFNRDILSFLEPKLADDASLRQACSPWKPATHPDGALYFYDPKRVRH